VLAGDSRQKVVHRAQHLPDGEYPGLDLLLPGDCQQLLDQCSTLFARQLDFVHVFLEAAIRSKACRDQIGIKADDGQQIVEIMSDRASESSYVSILCASLSACLRP